MFLLCGCWLTEKLPRQPDLSLFFTCARKILNFGYGAVTYGLGGSAFFVNPAVSILPML